MSITTERTTLVCLFHHDDQARAALEDLQEAGIPASSITTLRGQAQGGLDSHNASDNATHTAQLTALGIPARDLDHLHEGLHNGGTIISVEATSENVDQVESIFGDHRATKIDEADVEPEYAPAPLAAVTAGATAIPVVEEELVVGKRTVDQGGVRVYRRVVEIPAQEAVTLREEHVVIERNLVDRPATAADLAAQGTHTIELTETAEEAVVSKTAHVVEEVLVGKTVGERTEHIQDTVRHTEVEFEELPSTGATTLRNRNL